MLSVDVRDDRDREPRLRNEDENGTPAGSAPALNEPPPSSAVDADLPSHSVARALAGRRPVRREEQGNRLAPHDVAAQERHAEPREVLGGGDVSAPTPLAGVVEIRRDGEHAEPSPLVRSRG